MSDKKTFHTMEDQPGIKVDPWILKSQICDMIKYSTAAVDRKLADPESGFPKGVKLSPRKRVWRLSSILEWMEAQERKAANDPVYKEEV